MSDLADLIHKSTMIAYKQGIKDEQERILRLLVDRKLIKAAEAIKKEQK